MEISSIGNSYYDTTLTKTETVKQTSGTEEKQVSASQGTQAITDTFIKSAAAANTNSQSNDSAQEDEGLSAEKAAVSTGVTSSDSTEEEESTNISSQNLNTTNSGIAVTGSTTDDSSSSSEYTASEIAKYDLNGDGKIDAREAALMKAEQAQASQKNLSSEEKEAVKAYETAKNQLS